MGVHNFIISSSLNADSLLMFLLSTKLTTLHKKWQFHNETLCLYLLGNWELLLLLL